MGLLEHIGEARTTGALVTSSAEQRLRVSLQASLRRRIGITDNPPPPCDDPALAYVDPASIVRVIHSDFASMLIGGMASLLLQSLHPLAMAGVSDHSRYREDPLGRLERTAMFVGTTTFRTRDEAADALLTIIRKARTWNEGAARLQLLKFFEAWGFDDETTMAARRKLSALLFS